MWRPLFSNRYLASATVPLIRFLWNSACEFFIGIVEQVWVLLSQPSGSYTPLGHKWICVHMLFCMGVKLGRWHCRRKGSWGCLRKWCWGEYLDQGGTRLTGEWKRLHNEELNDLYSSPNIVQVIKWRRMRWAGHVAHMGEERGVYKVLLGKPEGKRPLGRPRRRWVDNIRMDLQEVGRRYVDWIGLAQDRDRWRTLVSAVMNLRVPWNAGNFLTSCKPVSFSRRTLLHGVSK